MDEQESIRKRWKVEEDKGKRQLIRVCQGSGDGWFGKLQEFS